MLQQLLPQQAGRGGRVDDEINALLQSALVLCHLDSLNLWDELTPACCCPYSGRYFRMAMSPEIASFVVLRSGVSLMTWIIQHAAFSISAKVATAIASRAVSLGIDIPVSARLRSLEALEGKKGMNRLKNAIEAGTGKQRQLAFVVRRLLDNSFCLSRDAPCQSFLGFSTRLNARWEFREGLVLPNWECDTDRAKGLAKLGLKSSAAALIAAAYWALSPGSLAFQLIPRLRQTAVRQSRGKKTKAGKEDATVGLGLTWLPGPKVGSGKNNMNSGEGHELNGSIWIRTRRKAVADFAPIEISACYTRSHVQLFCRMHRLLQMSKLSPGNINS